jgi:glucose/arabinose dehydrogenase
MFPDAYRNQIFIAEHGSWNRSIPIGYRVVVARPAEQGEKRLEIFAQGWLPSNGRPWGRPVDVLVAPDGALLVSDDYAGAIYRITYGE